MSITLSDLIPEEKLAAERGVHVRTLYRERKMRKGPAFIKIGRKIYYRPEAIAAWLVAQEQTPTQSGRAA